MYFNTISNQFLCDSVCSFITGNSHESTAAAAATDIHHSVPSSVPVSVIRMFVITSNEQQQDNTFCEVVVSIIVIISYYSDLWSEVLGHTAQV